MIRVGIVRSIDEIRAVARVEFPDTSVVSAEYQILVRGSLKNKDYWLPSIEEEVLCVLTEQKQGFIIGALYSDGDTPPVQSRTKRHMKFEDGTTLDYDTSNSTLTIQAVGPINIKASGDINVQGDVVADGISLKYHTHDETSTVTSKPNGGG
ncbi:phage baseplate assembly protein V [Gracilibacillus oryzae]|nr:phage baseplate assembly protein V [Gracilibacillus oryzae]